MIILEGPDGAGKSMLCHWLCEEYALSIGPRHTTNRDELFKCTREDTWWAINEELSCTRPPWVWDRLGPWSDPIYAPIRRSKSAFSGVEIRAVRALRLALSCPLVVCLPPFEVVKANVARSKQMEGVKDNLAKIYSKYSRLKLLNPKSVQYDYTKGDYTEVMKRVDYYLNTRKGRENLARNL